MGELQKRIDKSSFRILEAKVDTSNPKVAKAIGDFIGNINVINTEKAKMIVGEMRKDFPNPKNVDYRWHDWRIEVEKWYKKWLGEDQQ